MSARVAISCLKIKRGDCFVITFLAMTYKNTLLFI